MNKESRFSVCLFKINWMEVFCSLFATHIPTQLCTAPWKYILQKTKRKTMSFRCVLVVVKEFSSSMLTFTLGPMRNRGYQHLHWEFYHVHKHVHFCVCGKGQLYLNFSEFRDCIPARSYWLGLWPALDFSALGICSRLLCCSVFWKDFWYSIFIIIMIMSSISNSFSCYQSIY